MNWFPRQTVSEFQDRSQGQSAPRYQEKSVWRPPERSARLPTWRNVTQRLMFSVMKNVKMFIGARFAKTLIMTKTIDDVHYVLVFHS